MRVVHLAVGIRREREREVVVGPVVSLGLVGSVVVRLAVVVSVVGGAARVLAGKAMGECLKEGAEGSEVSVRRWLGLRSDLAGRRAGSAGSDRVLRWVLRGRRLWRKG